MRHLAIFGVFAAAAGASAQIVWDQSQLINLPNGGTGAIAGQHVSQLEAGETTFGFGVQGPPTNNVMADDFNVGPGAQITGFSVFAYTTGATAPNITGVNWAIGSTPTTASGLATANVASTFWQVGGASVYRTNAGDTFSSNRRIQVVTVTGLNINVGPGTYYLSFSVNPGNFSPPLPTSLATHGQNAMQSLNNAAFAPVAQGPAGADMAFIIHGNIVPEPASMAALGIGAAALIARRRRARR